jgi:hypothetical protein
LSTTTGGLFDAADAAEGDKEVLLLGLLEGGRLCDAPKDSAAEKAAFTV